VIQGVGERRPLVVVHRLVGEVRDFQPVDRLPEAVARLAARPLRAVPLDEYVLEAAGVGLREPLDAPERRLDRPRLDGDERPVLALAEPELEGVLPERPPDDRGVGLALDVREYLVGVDRPDVPEVLRGVEDRVGVGHGSASP